MPFERYGGSGPKVDYITPAFPRGHREATKTHDQVEHEKVLRAQDAVLAAVVSALRDLTSTEGWDCYTGQLEIIEKQITEELVTTPGNNDYLRGYVMGIRKATGFPEELARRLHEGR